jgi:hypothetical protein
MNVRAHPGIGHVSILLRGETAALREWSERWEWRRLSFNVTVIIAGAGLYGAAMGCWRDPLQALFVAIKLPLIVLLTAIGNALLNGMLAPLLGVNIPFRQSFLAIVMSFAVASAILGSFSPLLAFVVWNAPAMSPSFKISGGTYSFMMLAHVGMIAFAGIAANLRLLRLLRELAVNPAAANRVLFAWLAGNLFLGSQVSWILRPFIGSPDLPVQFVRDHPLAGNFYEAVFNSAVRLFHSN